MILSARDELVAALIKTGRELWDIDVSPEIAIPENMDFGDLATNLPFQLARELRRSPAQIAGELSGALKLPASFKSAEPAGGFINFKFSDEFLRVLLAEIIDKPADFGGMPPHGGKVNIEFVSANPTGPLNVVSARAAAVGSALVNILRHAGRDTSSEYYLNDAGNQIRELAVSFVLRIIEQRGFAVEFGRDSYRGDYLADEAVLFADSNETAVEELFSQIGDFRGTFSPEWAQDFFDEDPKRKAIFNGLQSSILERMANSIRETLDGFRTSIDTFFRETALRESGEVAETIEFLRAKGLTFEEDGALWFDTPTIDPAEEPFVLVKSDGQWTYGAVDIAYHKNKIERGFDEIYDIWGPDHHGHIGRMKAAIKALGFEGKFEVLTLQQVNLLEGGEKVKMSKREGNIVTLAELVEDVGVDVARFFFIARRMEAHLDFDLDLARAESDENPVYYVQYAHARISGILEHAKNRGFDPRADRKELASLIHPEELALARKLAQWPFALANSAEEMAPHQLCFYLIELAQAFHPFYAKHRVVSDDEAVTMARVALCRAIKETLALGLGLLGISAPENM
ncbi:MAG TPA: arginine--tRNA ligase [candidate division Zixibacteria bacterium]|nr:arginine--tRNA ligase [candidate division Zixibacteria bacterium]